MSMRLGLILGTSILIIIYCVICILFIIKLNSGKRQLNNGKKRLAQGNKDLKGGRKELDKYEWIPYWAMPKKLFEGYKQYNEGNRQYREGQEQYKDGLEQYKKGRSLFRKINIGSIILLVILSTTIFFV